MVQLNVNALLKKAGKSRYWLVKQLDTDYKSVNKLCNNQTAGIKFETLDRLKKTFQCDFNDLFIYVEGKADK